MQDKIVTYSVEEIMRYVNQGFVDVVAQDGVYRVTETPVGIFSVKIRNKDELPFWREGFAFALPPIPTDILGQIYAFFRYYARNRCEVMAQIYWNPEKKEYKVHIPMQIVTQVSVDLLSDDWDREVYLNNICVMDIHSHHDMEAFFSTTDDEDELATRLYAVIGRVNTKPELLLRYGLQGIHRMLRPEAVFEHDWNRAWEYCYFPAEWMYRVVVR